MGKYDGILLCSDFDGTLAYHGEISEENSRAIKYFQDNGGIFTMVSGRFPEYFAKHSESFVPNTYVIGLNGAVIFDQQTGAQVYTGEMPQGSAELADRIFLTYPQIRTLGLHSFSKYYPLSRETFLSGERPDVISKIVFIVDDRDSDSMMRTISDMCDPLTYSVARSWINGIELLGAQNTKGRAVKRLATMLGERVKRIVCVGDYENDISMLEIADIGYAVGNALSLVKSVADKITESNKDHAIAHIISEL